MSPSSRWTRLLFAAAAVASSLPAGAGGFALFEHGARSLGFAGAYTAQADDPSAIFHNAAGVAFLRQRQFYLGGSLVLPSVKFTGSNPFPGSGVTEKGASGLLTPPAIYYTQPFSDRTVFGVGVNLPFGIKNKWANPEQFSGRFIIQAADLRTYSVNPTIAHRLADRLSVGIGADVRVSTIVFQRRAAVVNPFTQKAVDAASVRLDSDMSTAFGFNVGVLAKPTETISLGFAYRHKVNQEYSGLGTFSPLQTGSAQLDGLIAARLPAEPTPLTTEIEFPAMASAGVAWSRGDWTVEADVNWYQWTSFDRLVLRFDERPELNQVIEQQYEDVFQYRVGVERVWSDTWAFRGGYVFDKSPTPVASVSPILPDSDRHGFALGASWTSGRVRLDVGNILVLFKQRATDGQNRERFDGTYKSFAEILSFSLGYSF